jgi:hypothetical protein
MNNPANYKFGAAQSGRAQIPLREAYGIDFLIVLK